MRSPSTRPGPIEGSWAASPTKTRWVPSAHADSRASASSTSSIDASSTTTTSSSNGHSSPRAKPPSKVTLPPDWRGWAPSSRWIVDAGASHSSSSRLAARPVGAARATVRPACSASETIAATVRLLPVPGPPVSTLTPLCSAADTAARWASSSGPAALRFGSALIGSAVATRRAMPWPMPSSASAKRARPSRSPSSTSTTVAASTAAATAACASPTPNWATACSTSSRGATVCPSRAMRAST